ncbi:hypothetical protein [Nesterenkonia sp.]|uniref:hypothetical protein n=1 Tax=Nesterenkonia sp. TaxID=704201 RepID=UPI0026147983|nr:hypothetical protein [Nesterenkonia sp.]
MSIRYPTLTSEVLIRQEWLAPGLERLSPASRSYLEVEANYVTLHIAVWTNREGVSGRIVIPAGVIPEEYRPQAAVRAPMRHTGQFVSALWGPTGQLAIEDRDLAEDSWLNGSIRAKRSAA